MTVTIQNLEHYKHLFIDLYLIHWSISVCYEQLMF